MIAAPGEPSGGEPADPARELRLTQARLDSLTGYHPDAVFALDLDGTFLTVNSQALVQSGGYTAEQLIGSSFVDLLYADDVPAVLERFAGLLEGEPSTIEVRFRRADDTVGELEIIGIPIVVDGEVVEIFGIAEDITERKLFQQALKDARNAAESASAAKTAFLTTMSHEIRTPLTSVLAAAEMLADSHLTPQQARLVTVMERSGERLRRLVTQVLDFSSIQGGQTDLVALPFSPVDLVDVIVLILRGAASEKGLALDRVVGPGLPARLVGDPERVAQVLSNLVDNAVKFTETGTVGVTVEVAGATEAVVEVRFAVTDTGIGLTPEQEAFVVEDFRQADSSITRAYDGTGLGLAISRRLVALMGGELSIDSTLGQGSTFTFVLPLERLGPDGADAGPPSA